MPRKSSTRDGRPETRDEEAPHPVHLAYLLSIIDDIIRPPSEHDPLSRSTVSLFPHPPAIILGAEDFHATPYLKLASCRPMNVN